MGKTKTRAKKKPGRNIKEDERNTVAVKLRLDPETAEDLKTMAEEMGKTMSQVVDAAMMALYRAKTDLEHVKGAALVYAAFLDQLGGPMVDTGCWDENGDLRD